jgi:hypothetical protein
MLLQCLPVLRGSGQETSTDTRQQKLEMLVQQKSIISELFESDTIDVRRKSFVFYRGLGDVIYNTVNLSD